MEMDCSAQEPYNLLIVTYRENGHTAGSEIDMLLRRTCNKGLTNLEYKSTPQDLTEKGWRKTQECRLRGFNVRI
jgi:hypothetical protein